MAQGDIGVYYGKWSVPYHVKLKTILHWLSVLAVYVRSGFGNSFTQSKSRRLTVSELGRAIFRNVTKKSHVKVGQLGVLSEVLACGLVNQKFHLTPWKVPETSNCNSGELKPAASSFILTWTCTRKRSSWL